MVYIRPSLRKKLGELDKKAERTVKYSTKENPTKSALNTNDKKSRAYDRLKKQRQIEKDKYYSGVKGTARIMKEGLRHFTYGIPADAIANLKESLKAKAARKRKKTGKKIVEKRKKSGKGVSTRHDVWRKTGADKIKSSLKRKSKK